MYTLLKEVQNMGEFFNHREHCVDLKQESRFGKIYFFEFPNGQEVEVSRDMKSIQGWFGYWRVATVTRKGIHAECFHGYKRPKDVAKFLKWVKELEVP